MEAQLETAETPIAKVGMGRTERGTAQRATAEQSQEKKSMSVLLLRRCRAEWRRNFWRKARTKGEREGLREPNVILQQIMEPSNVMPGHVPPSLSRSHLLDWELEGSQTQQKSAQMALHKGGQRKRSFISGGKINRMSCHSYALLFRPPPFFS